MIKIWNMDNGECIRTLTGHSKGVTSIELISSNRLASASMDNTIKIWNIASGAVIRTLIGHSEWVVTVKFVSPNRLASGSEDATIKIWNLDSGECIRSIRIDGNYNRTFLAFHLTDKLIRFIN